MVYSRINEEKSDESDDKAKKTLRMANAAGLRQHYYLKRTTVFFISLPYSRQTQFYGLGKFVGNSEMIELEFDDLRDRSEDPISHILLFGIYNPFTR